MTRRLAMLLLLVAGCSAPDSGLRANLDFAREKLEPIGCFPQFEIVRSDEAAPADHKEATARLKAMPRAPGTIRVVLVRELQRANNGRRLGGYAGMPSTYCLYLAEPTLYDRTLLCHEASHCLGLPDLSDAQAKAMAHNIMQSQVVNGSRESFTAEQVKTLWLNAVKLENERR